MDTDSQYYAIAASSLECILKNARMAERYNRAVYQSCHDRAFLPDSKNHWITRKCCIKCEEKDTYTAGLFKKEFSGTVMVCLCSKTWIIENEEATSQEKRIKFSSKGLNKISVLESAQNKNMSLVQLYKQVLDTGNSESAVNTGFRTFDNTMKTYSQKRNGLSYFYCKRRVLDDGISTVPLDLTLRCCKKDVY